MLCACYPKMMYRNRENTGSYSMHNVTPPPKVPQIVNNRGFLIKAAGKMPSHDFQVLPCGYVRSQPDVD